jgi:hypothetical protein
MCELLTKLPGGMAWVTRNRPKLFFNQIPDERRIVARFRSEVPLRVHCRTGELVVGRTVEASASGISAIVLHEIMIGQTAELGFQLPCGPISVQAMVKNQTGFRFGFEFVRGPEERDSIIRGWRALAFRRGESKAFRS